MHTRALMENDKWHVNSRAKWVSPEMTKKTLLATWNTVEVLRGQEKLWIRNSVSKIWFVSNQTYSHYSHSFMNINGQLISKCPFGVVSSNLPKKQQNFCKEFCPSLLKGVKSKQIRALYTTYTTNWMILFWISYTAFLIWPLFRG